MGRIVLATLHAISLVDMRHLLKFITIKLLVILLSCAVSKFVINFRAEFLNLIFKVLADFLLFSETFRVVVNLLLIECSWDG